jgi:hypothetical protein
MSGPSANNLGLYYGQGIPAPPNVVPGNISVINSGDVPPSMLTRAIVDEVDVLSAVYDPVAGTLTVVATSSDKGAPTLVPPQSAPVLRLDGYTAVVTGPEAIAGDPASYQFTVSGLFVPPPGVDVVSSVGGVGRRDITMAAAPPGTFPAGVPLAMDDVATATVGLGAINIPVKANDVSSAVATTAGAVSILTPGISPAGFGTLTALTDGTVNFLPSGATGIGTFKYTIANTVGTSNPATVTINVLPGASPIPTAVADSTQVISGQSVNIAVLANDLTNDSLALPAPLNPASVVLNTVGLSGTAVVNASGVVTYTTQPGSGTGAQTFTYTVANTLGNRSAPATVTVNVLPTETFNVASAKCTNGPKWDVRGTASASLNGTVTLYKTSTVTASSAVLAIVPVDATGAWRYTASGGAVAACISPISAKSSAGSVANGIIVTLR